MVSVSCKKNKTPYFFLSSCLCPDSHSVTSYNRQWKVISPLENLPCKKLSRSECTWCIIQTSWRCTSSGYKIPEAHQWSWGVAVLWPGVGAQLGASELKAQGDSGRLDAEVQLAWRSQHCLQMLLRSRDAVGLEHVAVRGWQVTAGYPHNPSWTSSVW